MTSGNGIILEYLNSGLSVFPCDPIRKSPKIESWTKYQNTPPDEAQVQKWFGNGHDYSPAIVAGKVSGNLEVLDFDENARQYQAWKNLVDEERPGLVDSLVCQQTQNGGIHVVYRCSKQVPGNQKLSIAAEEVAGPGEYPSGGKKYKAIQYRGKWVISPTLIETRGQGGYFLASPGAGYDLLFGSFLTIPTITSEERGLLIETAQFLSEYIKEQVVLPPPKHSGTGDRPGDEFNKQVQIVDLLSDDGWQFTNRTKHMPDGTPCSYWRRPGKDGGISGTVYDNKVYVFSSNCPPLDEGSTYDPFAYFTTTKHYGNFKDAAIDLSNQGFGEERKQSKAIESNVSTCKNQPQNESSGCDSTHNVSKTKAKGADYEERGVLSQAIQDYIDQGTGIFSTFDVDRDLSIVTRRDKNLRAIVLNRLAKALKIRKVEGRWGQWKKIDGSLNVMKLGKGVTEPLDLLLPLGISDLAHIFPGNIILIAGSPNSGKTGFCFRSLYTVLKNKKERKEAKERKNKVMETILKNGIHYLNSEMDQDELTDRVMSLPNGNELFGEAMANGDLKFIQRSRDFEDVINPTGINYIDFLEIHEDFFELGKLINNIFLTLRGGICIICCQKKAGADYAKGGSASLEKPRLVINLDKNDSFGCTCKIIKCKRSAVKGENHDGKEIDYLIDKDADFVKLSGWRHVNKAQRAACNTGYAKFGVKPIPEPRAKSDVYACSIKMTNADIKHLTATTIEKWEASFTNINVRIELGRIAEESEYHPFLKSASWFFQLSGVLKKKNDEQTKLF